MAKRLTTTERPDHPPVRYTMLSDLVVNHWLVTVLDNDGARIGHPSLHLMVGPDGRRRLTDDSQTAAVVGVEFTGQAADIIRGLGCEVGADAEISWDIPDDVEIEAAILKFAGVQVWLVDGLSRPSVPAYHPPKRARRQVVERHRNRRQKPNRTGPTKRPRSRPVAQDVPGTRVHTRRVQTMVTPDAYRQLESEADRSGISVSALVRRLISAHLAKPAHGGRQ